MQKALGTRSGWYLMDGVYGQQGKALAAFSEIKNKSLSGKGHAWYVFVIRNSSEVFAPLVKLVHAAVIAAFVLALFAAREFNSKL